MKLKLELLCSSIICMLLFGCESKQRRDTKVAADISFPSGLVKATNYTVFSADKYETTGKAQIKIIAYLAADFKDKSELEITLYQIYEAYRHEGGFVNFDEPTVVAVYLFETQKLAETDHSAWLGMLEKGPHSPDPDVMFNRFRLAASLGLKDNVLSEDEIQLAKIKKLLISRGIDMCELNKTVNDIELNSIHAADELYPDYGMEHNAYSDKLMRRGLKKLERKYRLTYNDIDRACLFAGTYCK
jgi:hypothetical protein